ncbi:MAG: type II toxin-antitoxin system VapC family toxin [Thermodesulfobacteriota bacterium]|nr:type II toxin-antitoxin system VapC family toxin [Thermodesulfobacteriota bacterium]
MNILLDTHVLIWALENNPNLSEAAKSAIICGENLVFVSSVSIWEIGIKVSLGKLKVPDNLQEELKKHRFTPLNITHNHAELAAQLPIIHKDPFDRMLIAQSNGENMTLVTRDEQICKYDVNILLA